MRAPRLLETGSARINMTPMIDVVFLLIVFFLVSSHLAKQENQLPLDLPKASSGLDESEASNTVTVNVTRDGAWLIVGRVITRDELARLLRHKQAVEQEPVRLRIRCDERVPYRRIAPILQVAADVGVGDVAFSVLQEGAS